MAQLLLEGIQPATAIEEVDGIAMSEEVSVDLAFEPSLPGGALDDLVGSLFGDVATLSGLE